MSASSSIAATSSSHRSETDDDGRIRELADVGPGVYRLVFHPPSPVLPPRRARARAGRPGLSRAAARLPVRVRDLPRKLSVEELAELFSGRTAFVERLAELEDPLGRADEVARGLTDEEKLEARRDASADRRAARRSSAAPSRGSSPSSPC